MPTIVCEVYAFDDPTTYKDVLPGRMAPTALNQLGAAGGGSVQISITDPKVVADPTLIDYRNIIKVVVVDGHERHVAGAFMIQTNAVVTVSDGEKSAEVYQLAGASVNRAWFEDAEVRPAGGLKSTSMDTRSFSFASERGDWYIDADWVAPVDIAAQGADPWPLMPDQMPVQAGMFWIWGEAYTGSAPVGMNYFRYEMTTTSASDYAIYAAGDNDYSVWVDGTRLMTSDPRYSAAATAVKTAFTLPAGDHVIGLQVDNASGKAGVIALLVSIDSSSVETPVTYTGDSGWLVNAYPTSAPGWSPGEILLKLLGEAEDRGVLFPTWLNPTFTSTHDSNGDAWGDALEWDFDIGEGLDSVVTKLDELSCDIWVDPDTYDLNVVLVRGVDRTGFTYDTDGVTALTEPIVFIRGKNLRSQTTQGRGKVKNVLSLNTSDGWVEDEEQDDPSVFKYGRLEGTLATGASISVSKQLAQVVLAHKAEAEEGASYDITTEEYVPNRDFNEGDWVLAPDKDNVLVPRQVMSISLEESDAGQPAYTLEFDTIFQSNDDRINNILSKSGSTGVGAGFANAAGGGSPFSTPIAVVPGIPIGGGGDVAQVPETPVNLAATAIGDWTADGVTPYSEITLTWDPVTEYTDGVAMVPDFYEVWAHLTSATDDALVMYATTSGTVETASMRPFVPGDEWTFKVRARKNAQVSDFSAGYDFTAVGPSDAMDPPDVPIVTSNKGVLVITWDGKLLAADPPPQFRYVYALVSAAGAGLYHNMGTIERDGRVVFVSDVTVGSSYDVALIAVDGAGIASAMSDVVTATVTGISGADLLANSVTANQIAAGTITAAQLRADVGGQLNIAGNSVIIAAQAATAAAAAAGAATSSDLATMKTYYSFGPSGAVISSPGSVFSLKLTSSDIEILQNGNVVSFWNSGQMNVASLVAQNIILGNHQIAPFGTGTIVKAL